jgi:hypothetical protein
MHYPYRQQKGKENVEPIEEIFLHSKVYKITVLTLKNTKQENETPIHTQLK